MKNTTCRKINNLFSSFISAYIESYNTYLSDLLKNDYFMGLSLWTFQWPLVCIPDDHVIVKLVAYGFDKNMPRYI